MPAITSLQNPVIKLIRSLADKKNRREEGLFVAEGEAMLARARRQGWEPVYVVSVAAAEPWGKAQMITTDEKVMAALSGQSNPSGQLAVFRQRSAPALSPNGIWIALEDMRDPGNLGTIIRTADAVSARGIVLVGDACDPWGPDCVRATTGSIFAVPTIRMTKPEFAAAARQWPGEVVGTAMTAATDFRRAYGSPTLLVMGSENRGLSPAVAEACSTLVGIPMPGHTESLNVAIATALVLYQIACP